MLSWIHLQVAIQLATRLKLWNVDGCLLRNNLNMWRHQLIDGMSSPRMVGTRFLRREKVNITGQQTAQRLLEIASPAEIEDFLKEQIAPDVLDNDWYWKPVGDRRSNAGSIEASADEINPLAERVVNSIEAVIELRIAQLNRNAPKPSDHDEAIEKLFDVPQGDSRRLDERTARELAQYVQMILRGDKSKPTIVIRDQGIGIHPKSFEQSIVSLGQSDKGQKPYLIGMYGQGGSSTFDKCDYTVIVSRLHPDFLKEKGEDQVGWTIVRRRLSTRTHIYSFLVDSSTGTVPFFSGQIGEALDLRHGTYIAHVEYRNLGGFAEQRITNYAYYTLNYRLFNPLIPWTLSDNRETMPNETRTMRGIPYRLDLLPSTTGPGSGDRSGDTSIRDHVVFDYRDESYGNIRVEWWVLQDERVQEGRRRREHDRRVDPYRDRTKRYAQRLVSITRGGQTHAALTRRLFDQRHLRQVARSIIVNVDTDALTFEAGASFFASNRADLKTASQEIIEKAILSAIDLYGDQLRRIERERQEEIIRGRGASDEDAIKRRLDPLIRSFIRTTLGSGDGTRRGGRNQPDFIGLQIPTYVRFARTGPLGIHHGIPTHSDLLTDAADSVIKDKQTDLRLRSNSDLVTAHIVGGRSGRWRVEIYCSPDSPTNVRSQLKATLERPGLWLETPRDLELFVEPPPAPYQGKYPPSIFRFRSQNGEVHVRQGGARITIDTDASDDLQSRATLTITPPDGIPFAGNGHPSNGQIRVSIDVPENADLGSYGAIRADLELHDGSVLSTEATLVVQRRSVRGGEFGPEQIPSYRIIDVREIPATDQEVSWDDMQNIFDTEWEAKDVAGYNLSPGESPEETEIIFYLNADNLELREAERHITSARMEATVDRVRQYHRTLLCYYLYQMAVNELERNQANTSQEGSNDQTNYSYLGYREEMMRLNKTLIYAQREFLGSLETLEEEGQ